jgi:poly(A) polymerase
METESMNHQVHSMGSYLHCWLSNVPEKHLPPLYLVGGSVRDIFLGRNVNDIDIVCKNAKTTAEEIAQVNDARVVVFKKREMELCYRVIDKERSGPFLDITPMQGDSLDDDLFNRDFTVNAMAKPVTLSGLGSLIDPLGGEQDLKMKLVRAVEENTFDQDPVRMLRAFRFAAQLGFQIHGPTLEMIKDKAALLRKSASERIMAELLLLLSESPCFKLISLMDETGLLEVIFPEISTMRGCEQNSFHHQDVWGHSLAALKSCEDILARTDEFFGYNGEQVRKVLDQGNWLPLLKLGALLHDLGKPKTKGENAETGRITFYGHDRAGAEMIEAVAERLKMSNQDRELLKVLVGEHLHIQALSQPELKTSTRIRFFRKHRDLAVPVIILGQADIKGRLGPDSKPEEAGHYKAWAGEAVAQYFQEVRPALNQTPLINGRDLLELGLKPGPRIGLILEDIQLAQDDGEILDRDQALELAERLVKKL